MISAFAGWLLAWGKSLAVIIANFFIDFINVAIVSLVAIISTISNLLPSGSILPLVETAPVAEISNIFITTLNWLFPVHFLIAITSIFISAILAYVVIAPLARWVKLLR